MFEVIWSMFSNAYIVRPVNSYSTVKPMFIGTDSECNSWITKNITGYESLSQARANLG